MVNRKPLISTFFFLLIVSLTIQTSHAQLPNSVLDEVASREMRYKHHLWHTIRNDWNSYDQNTQKTVRDFGWEPPRPAISIVDGRSIANIDNNCGEDFLYMHRQMIRKVRQILQDNNLDYDISGWTSIPAPGDREWPVPPSYDVSGSASLASQIGSTKTNAFYYSKIKPMEETFNDIDQLRTMTLGELGTRIEYTIHNWLHLRFSSGSTVGYRPEASGAFPFISKQWDNPDYDWLADTYSSHVIPVFWKIHGWVDDRIEDWRRANELDEIQWTGTWEGGPIENLMDMLQIGSGSESSSNGVIDAVALGAQSGGAQSRRAPHSSFADDVQIDFEP